MERSYCAVVYKIKCSFQISDGAAFPKPVADLQLKDVLHSELILSAFRVDFWSYIIPNG